MILSVHGSVSHRILHFSYSANHRSPYWNYNVRKRNHISSSTKKFLWTPYCPFLSGDECFFTSLVVSRSPSEELSDGSEEFTKEQQVVEAEIPDESPENVYIPNLFSSKKTLKNVIFCISQHLEI